MQKCFYFFLAILFQIPVIGQSAWIRINQLGYLPNSVKVAVFISSEEIKNGDFQVKDRKTDRILFSGEGIAANAGKWGMKSAFRLNFSTMETSGEYYVECNGAKSPSFRIDAGAYNGSADFILNYMRQQRCGFNPYLDTLCHQHDGFIVDHPTRTGEKIDVRGGWHDASDYLQYLPTSANAVFQMLFAWQQTPDKTIFKDEHDAMGRKGANGIPDILDEIRWGLEWMLRMNPEPNVMFNQIADDRDHAGMRIPSRDYVDYGWGKGTGRPVYFITGKSQGLRQYKNRTEGVSSSAAKFASAFTLGARMFEDIDPAFASILKEKSDPAYTFAESDLGCTQTACTVSPYFYEEDNYVDDMELAASVKYNETSSYEWLKKANYWGQLEEVTPWMELGRARHYQFYPFINLGHFYLSLSGDSAVSQKYTRFMSNGLGSLLKRAKENNDPFLSGIPFIWCSNNLVTAAVTQARLYYQTSGDDTYLEMEAALRDWLFGCNPWGTSMICGLPKNGDSPMHPQSFVPEIMKDTLQGGLVDGPVYRSIYNNLLGIHLFYEDPYAPFQMGEAVYHDDPGDYSTNEPTMDGTASLSFYLSSMEKEGKLQKNESASVIDTHGAMVKLHSDRKVIHLIFSADTRFEGGELILQTLDKNKVKASFFLTGNCLRTQSFEPLIKKIIKQGHYVGGHSDNHLLYASWDNRQQSLVSADSLINDFRKNMSELEKFGVKVSQVNYFLPPYEYYNQEHTRLIRSMGQIPVNFTPSVRTAADYTTPDMSNYQSAQALIDQLFAFEEEHGLNGNILLIHPGTEASRVDKLYLRLDEIIKRLKKKGYIFSTFK
jgi:peptidoglycan/xylan/chitin deacetylase (PgdA/CDA1 family)